MVIYRLTAHCQGDQRKQVNSLSSQSLEYIELLLSNTLIPRKYSRQACTMPWSKVLTVLKGSFLLLLLSLRSRIPSPEGTEDLSISTLNYGGTPSQSLLHLAGLHCGQRTRDSFWLRCSLIALVISREGSVVSAGFILIYTPPMCAEPLIAL